MLTDSVAAITLLLAKATEEFTPILGHPTDNSIFKMRKTIMPILHNIKYANFFPIGGTAHNLVGLIQESSAYGADWHAVFPRPARPAPYDINVAGNATTVV